MGLNCDIDADWTGRPLLPVQLHRQYCAATLRSRGQYFDRYNQIIDIFKQPMAASLIYFFCHGAADRLQFDKSKPDLTPNHVSHFPNYPGWPIVFINACDAGDISPLSFFSFRQEFRTRKAAGLVAPSFPIPTLFAALFARMVIERYRDHQPIGQVLFDLRRELLAKNNPLGLWYSVQCPLDVAAPEQ